MSDDLSAARAVAERAWIAQREINELVASTTDGGDRQTADEGVPAGSPTGVETGQVATGTPNSPSAEGPAGVAATASAGPYTEEEYAALVAAVWDFDGCEEDLTRFDELLTAALAFIARLAMEPGWGSPPSSAARSAALLRSMEQRALWGPDHPVRQP